MGAYNDDVLFIHIPKTAGWSVKLWLRDNLPGVLMPDAGRGVPAGHPQAGGLPLGHVRLADIPHYTERPIDSWPLVIAILRNPYEQQLSQWLFWLFRWMRGQRHVHDYVASKHSNLTEFLLDPRNDFHAWYTEHHKRPPTPRHEMYTPVGLYDWWYTVDGIIPPNVRLIPLERMAVELPQLIRPYAPEPLTPLPHTNQSPRPGEWWEYYTPEALRIVENKFYPCFEAGWYPRFPVNQLAARRPPLPGYVVPGIW